MDQYMLAKSITILDMEKEFIITQIKKYTAGTGFKTNSMVKDHIYL